MVFFLSVPPLDARSAKAGGLFENLDEVINALNLTPYQMVAMKTDATMKIAVFDDAGFDGYEDALGKTLPENVTYHPGARPFIRGQGTHGLKMAQIVYAVMTDEGEYEHLAPEFHFFNTTGYSNFKAAADAVAEGDFDFVLCSQVWIHGGNGDGTGFINTLVSDTIRRSAERARKITNKGRETRTGVIWFNSAGNYRDRTYVSQVDADDDGWVKTDNPNNTIGIRCNKDYEECPVTIFLTWGEVADDIDTATDQDLDLVLYDDALEKLTYEGGNLIQVIREPSDKVNSNQPYEFIKIKLKPGRYLVRVKVRSKNFSSQRDRFQVVAHGEGIELEDQSQPEQLGVAAPADNPDVITVGAFDAAEQSSISIDQRKPDWLQGSLLTLKGGGGNFAGSSNANAILLSAAAVLKSLIPSLNRGQIENVFGKALVSKGTKDTRRESEGGVSPSTPRPYHPWLDGAEGATRRAPVQQQGRFVPPGMPVVQRQVLDGRVIRGGIAWGTTWGGHQYPPNEQQQGYRQYDTGGTMNPSRDDSNSSDNSEDLVTLLQWGLDNGCDVGMSKGVVEMECPFSIPSDIQERVDAQEVSGYSSRGGDRAVSLPPDVRLDFFMLFRD
jgi:hypothetical protein